MDTRNTSTRRTEQRRSKSTELHIPDWMTGGRAGGHSSIRDGGSSQRAEMRTGRHELMAATGSSTADERAAGEAVKVQQIDDERVVDELLLLCRRGDPATTGRPRSAAGKAKSRPGGTRSAPEDDESRAGRADGGDPNSGCCCDSTTKKKREWVWGNRRRCCRPQEQDEAPRGSAAGR